MQKCHEHLPIIICECQVKSRYHDFSICQTLNNLHWPCKSREIRPFWVWLKTLSDVHDSSRVSSRLGRREDLADSICLIGGTGSSSKFSSSANAQPMQCYRIYHISLYFYITSNFYRNWTFFTASILCCMACICMLESKTSFGWNQLLMCNVRLFIWFSFHYNCLLVRTCLLYVSLSHCILSVCCLMANNV